MAVRRTVGSLLKAYRHINGISTDVICKIGRFSKSTIAKLESCSYHNVGAEDSQDAVSVNVCEKIAKCMQMKLSEFFQLVEEIEQEKEDERNSITYLKVAEYLLKKKRNNEKS